LFRSDHVHPFAREARPIARERWEAAFGSSTVRCNGAPASLNKAFRFHLAADKTG
jgi:hypothetical protein